ncbi:hypothetical protein TG4357_01212 [Thalassovita gelatinovora]|uniref:DUF4760 domain-containing protein n=1 Tax=Thalassovita gelatinovora TaxID=53501 RepID=A0A0P1F8N3_THAGE|nr:hypothetical protein [Thalassovita gelatinovora]QIZ80369.1 hypothetical protein HFZ77_07720 [Thalassovita gelatinovora]CUH64324.1 hypothetical protein TG4357_01212 [Thalassovita gelatinovora]SEQ93279.1 hypothetical protein SAMN04488043_11141 [Thalassovita gelatinovora]
MEYLGTEIFDWISLLVNATGAGATAILAWLVYHWTKNSERNEVTRTIQNDWRDYNLAVLADQDLQDLEASNHIFDGLTPPEVKKMCIYFIKINVPYNMWIASKNKLLTQTDVDREIENQSKLLFSDRAFIRKHVFPRGYDSDFSDLFNARWAQMEIADKPGAA